MEQWHPLGVVGVISRFQFPGRGLVVERGAGRGLRRRHGLESLGENAAHRDRGDQDRRARLPRNRRRSGDFHLAHGRSQNGRAKTARRDRRIPLDLGHRLDADGTAGRANGPRPAGQDDPGTRRQQRAHRCAQRGSRNGDAIDFLRRGRHGGAALHLDAARDRARIGRRQSARRNFWRAYKSVPIGNPLDRKTLMGPLIDAARGRCGAAIDPALEGRRRRDSLRRRTSRRRAISRRLLHDAVPGERETRLRDRAARNVRAAALSA